MKILKRLVNLIENFRNDQSGSAIVEFVILALPLFIPLSLYLTSVNEVSTIQTDTRNYARQLARVYVTSPNPEDIPLRIQELNQTFSDSIFRIHKLNSQPAVTIQCSLDPCLSPNSRVSVKVEITSIDGKFKASAQVTQIVDAWRNS